MALLYDLDNGMQSYISDRYHIYSYEYLKKRYIAVFLSFPLPFSLCTFPFNGILLLVYLQKKTDKRTNKSFCDQFQLKRNDITSFEVFSEIK